MSPEVLSSQRVWTVVALALAVRVLAIFALGTWQGGPGASGAFEHDVIAREILAGHGFAYPFYAGAAEATATQAPVIPAMLALCYALLGAGSTAATLAAQLFGALLSVPAMWGLVWLTRSVLMKRVGTGDDGPEGDGAGWQAFVLLGFALAPPFVYMVTRIQSIVWSVCLLLFVLGLFARFAEQPGVRRGVEAGAGVGIACLGEPILALPLGLAWCVLAAPRRAALGVWLVPAVAALCVLPWVVRNTVVLEEPTFIKSSFWYVFWQGNHVGASGTDKLPVEAATADALRWQLGGRGLETSLEAARRQATSVDAHLSTADVDTLLALPGEAARMAWFGERIRAELSAAPGRYVRMVGRRLFMLVWFDDTNPRSFVLPYRLPYLVLAALAVAGAWRWGAPRGSDWLALAAALGLVVALGGIITSARFRLLLESLMLLPAAWAMVWLVPGLAMRVARPAASE